MLLMNKLRSNKERIPVLKSTDLIVELIGVIAWSVMYSYYNTLLAKSIEPVTSGDRKALLFFIIMLILYPFLWEIVEWLGDTHTAYISSLMENNIQKRYLKQVNDLQPKVISKYSIGYIASLVNKFIIANQELVSRLTATLPITLTYGLYFTYVLSKYNILFGVFFVICNLVAAFVRALPFIIPKLNSMISVVAETRAERDRLLTDFVLNLNTGQKMSADSYMLFKFNGVCDQLLKCETKRRLMENLFYVLFKLFAMSFMPVCLFVYANNPSSVRGSLVELVSMLISVSVQTQHIMRGLGRILVDYSDFRAVSEKLNVIVSDENVRRPLTNDSFSSVQIKNLDFVYDDVVTKEQKHICIENMIVNKGDKVCIYGKSGEGKSTTLNVLSSEIETDCVYVNGSDIHFAERLDCAFIAQDTEIFDASVRDNMVLGCSDIEDSLIYQYFDACGLKQWLDKQPDGLDTILGERGCYVSTGQRQRLNFVRGLLMSVHMGKEVYLLDEPTSNVDDLTEVRMLELLKTVLKDKTVIIVTHRPLVKDMCNVLYEFVDGHMYLRRFEKCDGTTGWFKSVKAFEKSNESTYF